MSDSDSYNAQRAAVWAELELLMRRFQALSAPAWEPRRQIVLDFFEKLVTISARLEQRSLPPLPDLPSFAFADVFAVLVTDVLVAIDAHHDGDALARLLSELGLLREATR